MKTLLFVGGPLILFVGFSIHSDLLTFTDQHPGMVHVSGVPFGGMFQMEHTKTYRCDEGGSNCVLVDEQTEVTEIEGLELEQEAIEYREGSESHYNKTKQPGIAKYTNIHFNGFPTGIDWKSWKFTFEREAALDAVREEYDQKQADAKNDDYDPMNFNDGNEMIEVDPPILTIPAN